MVDSEKSITGVLIRLTDERWLHITTQHQELENMHEDVLQTIASPERILAGHEGELLAIRTVDIGKWLVVVYRENEEDGFIITAFLTRRFRSLENRVVIWSPSSPT